MKSGLKFLAFFPMLFSTVFCQSQGIGKGWAKNSVNTVVFRKNAVVSHKQEQFVAFYDSLGSVTLAKRQLGSQTWKVKHTQHKGDVSDAHRSISIMVDGDGYVHMSWNHHGNDLHYCKGMGPGSLEMSEQIPMVGNTEQNVTYPEFYKFPNGDLFFLYRDGSSGNGNLVINRYQLETRKWSRVQDVLIDGEGQRNAYWQACVDPGGVFHISWVWRESGDVFSNHDMCYAKTKDFGKSWQKSSGETYHLPINLVTAETIAHIPQGSDLINQTSMYAGSSGLPYIATYFRPDGSMVPQYHLIHLTGNGWRRVQISNRTSPFTLRGGGTKKIPLSRPQVMVDDSRKPPLVAVVYRDIEHMNKVTLAVSEDAKLGRWRSIPGTMYPVDSWEPSYDTELWKEQKKLHLFVQKTGQGDGEKLEQMDPQAVHILELNVQAAYSGGKGSLTDSRDNQSYKTLCMGTQIWMTQNLNFEVPGSWCYDNDPLNCDIYGRLYTWETALEVCPDGWHLPSEEEWVVLERYLGLSAEEVQIMLDRGEGAGTMLRDASGFNALPGGFWHSYNETFEDLGKRASWWSSTPFDRYAMRRTVFFDKTTINRDPATRSLGFNVRCIKN